MISYEDLCQALDRFNGRRRNEAEMAQLDDGAEMAPEATTVEAVALGLVAGAVPSADDVGGGEEEEERTVAEVGVGGFDAGAAAAQDDAAGAEDAVMLEESLEMHEVTDDSAVEEPPLLPGSTDAYGDAESDATQITLGPPDIGSGSEPDAELYGEMDDATRVHPDPIHAAEGEDSDPNDPHR